MIDSLITTLLLHLVIEDNLLIFSNDQNDTDAEQKKAKDIIKVLKQTEFDTLSGTEDSPKHDLSRPQWCFSNSENFSNQPANLPKHYTSLKFEDEELFSAATNDTLRKKVHPTFYKPNS